MPIILYMVVIFVVLLVIGLFWFMQSQNNYRGFNEFSSFTEPDNNIADVLLLSGLRKLGLYSERGKWMLFIVVFFLLVEFFGFIGFFIHYSGLNIQFAREHHLLFIAALLFFMLLVFALVLSLKLTSVSRELPLYAESSVWGPSVLEQKFSELSQEQKVRLTYFVIEKKQSLEQSYSMGIILIASAVTLLLTVFALWFFYYTI